MSALDSPAYATRSRTKRTALPAPALAHNVEHRPQRRHVVPRRSTSSEALGQPTRDGLPAEADDPEESLSSPLTPFSSQEDLVPPSSLRLTSLDREIESLAFDIPQFVSTPPARQQRPDRILCSIPLSQPHCSLSDLFTPAGEGAEGLTPASSEPSSRSSGSQDHSLYLEESGGVLEEGSREAERLHGQPSARAKAGSGRMVTLNNEKRQFAQLTQLRDLFDDASDDDFDDPSLAALVPISSAFKADNYSLPTSAGRRKFRRVSNADLENYPRLTFSSCKTPTPSRNAKKRKSATNKPGVSRSKHLKQLKQFPPKLKPIERSPLKFWKEGRSDRGGPHIQVEFDRRQAAQLLAKRKKRPRRSRSKETLLRWPFTPSKDKDDIQTPQLPPSLHHKYKCGPRNAKVPRLPFSRQQVKMEPAATAPPGPSGVANSCPSEPSSTATHDLVDLCGTASFRQYKLPSPPPIPSGMSSPPPLDVDREIEMWEENAEQHPPRVMTLPDEIQGDMASWGRVPDENHPGTAARTPFAEKSTPPVARQVLGDITSRIAPNPAPSLSGVDLTGHLMALADRLEPVRTLPQRRQHHRRVEHLQAPHQTAPARSTSTPASPVRGAVARSQPSLLRAESRQRAALQLSTVIEKNGPWVSARSPPSQLDAAGPPLQKPSSRDAWHAELAKTFTSFAAYLQQREDSASPRPDLDTGRHAQPLRGTISAGHTSHHRSSKREKFATQVPIRGP